MTSNDFAAIAFYMLGSVGGSSIIIFALSSWLGKIWAQRIMDKERATHENALEKLRSDLTRETTHHLRAVNDKLAIYRMVIDLIIEVLGDFDRNEQSRQPLNPDRMDNFNRQRMRVYGYLGMMTSQDIMDAQDALMDHLLEVAGGTREYVWSEVRELAINLLNEMRKDLKFDVSPIAYRGRL